MIVIQKDTLKVSVAIDMVDYILIDINSVPYHFTPKDKTYSVSFLTDRFNYMRGFSYGKALSYVKKYAEGVVDYD